MADAILTASGIYAIKNKRNGKVYVGSSTALKRRKSCHFRQLLKGDSPCVKLQHAVNKYGIANFHFVVLEAVADASHLLDREEYWIEAFSAVSKGYNTRKRASSNLGMSHDLVTRAQIGAKLSEYLQQPHVKAKMSKIRTGVKRSEETREKLKGALEKARKAFRSDPTASIRAAETKRRRFLDGCYEVSDMQRAAAARNGRLNAGSANGQAKMDSRSVIEMRALHAAGMSTKDISAQFNMSFKQTRDIVTMRAWKHIQGDTPALGSLNADNE